MVPCLSYLFSSMQLQMTSCFLRPPGSANIPQNRPENSLHEEETLRETHRECPNVQAIGREYFMFARCARQTLYWSFRPFSKSPINSFPFYGRLQSKICRGADQHNLACMIEIGGCCNILKSFEKQRL